MRELKKPRIIKRISIITLGNYYSKAMGLIFFISIIAFGGKELISKFYPVYLMHVFVVTINYYGFGFLILKRNTVINNLSKNSLLPHVNQGYKLFSMLFICLIITWLIIIKPHIELIIGIIIMIPGLWIYAKINFLRCYSFAKNKDWKVIKSQMLDSTVRVILSITFIKVFKMARGQEILLSTATILSALCTLIYLSKTTLIDTEYLSQKRVKWHNKKALNEMVNALALACAALLIPVMGWVDDFMYRLLFDIRVVEDVIGTLGMFYTLINSFVIVFSSVFIVKITERKLKIPLKKIVLGSMASLIIIYFLWNYLRWPENNYSIIILLIPGVIYITGKIFNHTENKDSIQIIFGITLLIIMKITVFSLLKILTKIDYQYLSTLSSMSGIFIMSVCIYKLGRDIKKDRLKTKFKFKE